MSTKKCELYELDSTSLCFQCKMYLCETCFKYIHDKNAKSGHKKELIDFFVKIDIKCPLHPDNYNSLFCINEKSK